MGIATFLGRALAGYLNNPSRTPLSGIPTDPKLLARTLRPGDVLLVEGNFRISTAIKYLTQSTWSHAVLCVQGEDSKADGAVRFVEADVESGVRIVTLNAFANLATRICRPVGLTNGEIAKLVDFALSHVGDSYDLKNVIDLARYLFPTPPVPTAWRQRMIAFGSGEPTKAICSTLIASCFQSVSYPILPKISHQPLNEQDCEDCFEEILHVRHHSFFTPRDFDVSPYFVIVKPSLESAFNHRKLIWGETDSL